MERPAAIPAVIAVAIAATLLVAVAAATSFGRADQRTGAAAREGRPARDAQRPETVERFLGEPRPAPESAAPEPSRRARGSTNPPGFGVVRVRSGRRVPLYSKPKGSGIGTVAARSEFGSRSVMSVVRRRGRWLAVTTTGLANGRVAWIRADSPAVDRGRVRMAISVDLSNRTLELRRGKRLVESVRVAIGRPGSVTPRGRFSITDKIPGTRYGAYYGCCILALNGTQPNPPPGWRGGNRLAIHGTNAPGSIGKPSSAGCLRAADADLRTLMRRVPLGTPVFIHG